MPFFGISLWAQFDDWSRTSRWTLIPGWGQLFSKSLQPGIKVHLEIPSNFSQCFVEFQSLTKKPVFECSLAHPMILFLSYLVKNSIYRLAVICTRSAEFTENLTHKYLSHPYTWSWTGWCSTLRLQAAELLSPKRVVRHAGLQTTLFLPLSCHAWYFHIHASDWTTQEPRQPLQ